MKLLNFLTRQASAPVARERLQLLLAHERGASGGSSDLLEALRTEILQVIGKHVAVDSEKVKVSVDRREAVAMLAIDIEIRAPSEALLTKSRERLPEEQLSPVRAQPVLIRQRVSLPRGVAGEPTVA